MPLSRYQIRNEYSLADPDLYKVADKDDPEALLEGVAMAGLVGVLRQLGDLAEFAAEIFHDLHEEVMATAARGHGLIVRVQQLEAEFPLVERTLLSQTNHTAFLYNSGIDWHSNARMDENVVTRGDLPRFVMDSYEECRGPPRLFLLDKFDVAGAGACLKRFTDPSFFKAEATSLTGKKSDGQREKRTRRVKKRGPRWRNEATPESFPSSHAKLHQLFLEELIETGGNDPDRRVKLKKKQFTGSLFDQDKRQSYMEKFLDSCSPEQRIVHEVCIDALPLTWRSDDCCETGLEIVEIGTVSPLKETMHPSPDNSEIAVKSPLEGFNEDKLNDITDSETAQDPRLGHDSDDGKTSSAIQKVRSEQAFADRESRSEVGGVDDDGGNSDDVASEIDNYMDALATMESEVETDSECKSTRHYLNLKPIVVDSDASEGLREHHSLFSDSQSLRNSTASEDGNNSFKERQCSSRSMSVNSLGETTPYLDAAVVAVPSVSPSNSNPGDISLEHHSPYEEVLKSETEECKMSTGAIEADETSKTVQEYGNASNTSHLADPNITICSVDTEATLGENFSTSPLDEVCSNSAESDILSEISDPRHANQTTSSSFIRTVLDAPESTYSGHWSNAQQPLHDMASKSSIVCSESLGDCGTTHDGLVQIEPKKTVAASSSVEEHSNDFGMGDVSAISDPNVQEIENLDDQYSASDSRWKFNDQEQSGMTNPSYAPPPDYAAAAPPSSQRDSGTEEVFANVEGKEKVSSAPIVGHIETLPLPISSGLCASEFSFSGTTDAAETAEHGSLEAALAGAVTSVGEPNGGLPFESDGEMMGATNMVGKPSPVLDSSKTEDEFSKPPFKVTDAAVLELHMAETGKQYPGNETSEEQNSVSTGGDGYRAAINVVAVDGDDVYRNITDDFSNQPDPIETAEHLDKTETQAVQADTSSGHDCNNNHDKNEAFSHDKFPFDGPFKLANSSSSSSIFAAQSDSNQLHDVARLGHKQTGTDGSRQVDIDGSPEENSFLSSSSSLYLEKVQNQPPSVTKDYHHNEDEFVTQGHVDHPQDAPVNSYYSMCSKSFDGCPDVISQNGSLAEDVQNTVKFNVIEAPFISESGRQYVNSTSSDQVNLLEGMKENTGSLSVNLSEITVHKGSDLHDDGSQVNPLLAYQQIRTQEFVDTEENSASLRDHTSMPKLLAQPAMHELGSSTQPMVESISFFFPGNNMRSGANQATRLVENLEQPIQTPSFPVFGMLPSEPQISLDSLPLPPLPPMQWRMSRFQNSSTATQSQMVQCMRSPVQLMTLPTNDNETDPFNHTYNGSGQPGYSNGQAEQGVKMQPLLAPDSEVSLVNMNGIQTEDLSSLANPTCTRSLDGAQISEESYQPSENFVGTESFAGHASGNDSPVMEAKVDVNVQNDQLEHIPQVIEQAAANSYVHFSPSSPVHYDWQPPPGLMAPEARRAWSSAYDGLPTDAGVYGIGALQKKPPRPRNPLIDEVVAIDKSKLRKVERAKPSVESKPEGGESFLEQLQLRKVERIKPPVESKAQEGESLLDHLHLRNVREKVKRPVELKSEEREFLLPQLQLRKVGESVKPQTELKTERELPLEHIQLRKVEERDKSDAEQKAEETASLRVQLRKASERLKAEVEHKSEETESPRVQLRKVNERVKQEIQEKPEETESPRMQLRRVSEIVKHDVQQKPEETESPQVQLRKVGQLAIASVAPNSDKRDSIFEQIRNKSFSLKPAVAVRPNIQGIQGPRTNLKVAAILEKASTIRQAMAGSDEEDDDADNWSDC